MSKNTLKILKKHETCTYFIKYSLIHYIYIYIYIAIWGGTLLTLFPKSQESASHGSHNE